MSELDRERIALSLLRRAGRRSAPPPDVSDRVHAAVLDLWAREVARRRRRAWRAAFVAGVVITALGASLGLWHRQLMQAHLASVTRVVSGATVMRGHVNHAITSGFELQSGDRIDVPAGSSLAAKRSDGVSVRVNGPSYLVWDTPRRIQLARGRVYVDVGDHPDEHHDAFEVRTPFARIEHIGTRFIAEASPARVRVAVRDGRVRMTSLNGDVLGLESGQAAEAAGNGRLAWATPPARAEWEWVDSLAPVCDIEGRVLFDVLTDLSREADLQLVFQSPAVERRAHTLTLHGPALELPPRTALDAVLATTDLDADLIGQRVVLKERMTGT